MSYTSQRQSENSNNMVENGKDTQGDRVEMHGDTVELAEEFEKPKDSVVETELEKIKRDMPTECAISLPMKDHNVVAHWHVPKLRDSVVEREEWKLATV